MLTRRSADSPYPPTPTPPSFNSDPSVAEGNQHNADPFETSAKVLDEAATADTPAVPPKRNPQHIDLQRLPSLLNDTGVMVCPGRTDADIPALGRSVNHLEKPLMRITSSSFHGSPRQYTLGKGVGASKFNDGAPSAVFVVRSSPQVLQDGSDDEFEPDPDQDDDKTAYTSPCEDSKINELVSTLANLSLGVASTVAPPTITPTCVRAHVFPFATARTPTSHLVKDLRSVATHLPPAQYTTLIRAGEGGFPPEVPNKGTPHIQETPEAVLMDGVVFHPNVRDMEMADTFDTNRELHRATFVCLSSSLIV